MLNDIGITFSDPTIMHCDDMSIINMSVNLVLHSKTKNVAIKYHFMSVCVCV